MTKKTDTENRELSKEEREAKRLSNLNRAGRPVGAKNKTTLFKEAMREGFENRLMVDGQKVFDACVQKAIEGDTTAMKLIMDRILPIADVQQGKGTGSGKIVINVQGMGTNIEVMDGEFEELDEVKDVD